MPFLVDYTLAMGDNSTLSRQSMKTSSAVDLSVKIAAMVFVEVWHIQNGIFDLDRLQTRNFVFVSYIFVPGNVL